MRSLIKMMFPLLALVAFAGENKNVESFQVVWDIVNEKHWDLAGTGLDWDEIYKTYKPQVEAAKTTSEARKVISTMLSELNESHIRLIEGGAAEDIERLTTGLYRGDGTPGFELVLVDARVFISKIFEGSDAAKQGLGIGTEILEVRGESVEATAKKILTAYQSAPSGRNYVPDTLNLLVSGNVGDELPLKVIVDGKVRELKVALTKPRGSLKQMMSLSGLYFLYESKVLDNNIGYLTFNIFLPDVRNKFMADISGPLKDTDGLIIDLRGNPGGLGVLAVTIANKLVSEKGKRLGQMINRGSTMNFPIFPQGAIYDKPVAILIDGGSASTSEILAAGLQDLKRARVFGYRSPGAAQPSLIETLPNGDRFQYAIADYRSFSGLHLEGEGVTPDELTPHTLESMKRKEDAAIAAASKWIRKKNSGDSL